MATKKVLIAAYPARERVRFVVYRIDPLANEYHVYKEGRGYDQEQWRGAIYQREQTEEVARLVAQSCAASYQSIHKT